MGMSSGYHFANMNRMTLKVILMILI